MSTDPSQLPACAKCRIRKVRCDRGAPKCGNCMRGNVACIIVDVCTGQQYARDYIHQLEQEEIRLRAQLDAATTQATATSRSEHTEQTPRGPLTGETGASHGGFVGDGSGLGFLHHILSEDKWQRHRARILEQLADRPRIADQTIVQHDLPPLPEAEQLLDNYFTRFHIHHTFLLRHEVLDIFYRLYGQSTSSSVAVAPLVGEATAQDRFRLLMVFAISATTRYRNGLCAQHPHGYYLAAETLLDKILLIGDIEAIQNLLLIARFGMYHHIGCSLWEISQVCMRQCIELRLHEQSAMLLHPLREQHHRRIFWECYVLDRYSSGILGRPFAVSEDDITVLLPVNLRDDHITTARAGTLDVMSPMADSGFTEMSIFIVFIELRRISSRIHTTFYIRKPAELYDDRDRIALNSVGQIYAAYVRFKSELDAWRSNVPTFANPRSLYERADWHDFMYHKDMLLLTRGSIHNLSTSLSTSSTSIRQLLEACYMAAMRVIQLYDDLMKKGVITWTRSYFQVIFTAGLTMTYCIGLGVLTHSLTGNCKQTEAVETLTTCGEILSYFKDRMPDAGSFAVVFDLLKEECIAGLVGNASLSLDQGVGPSHTELSTTVELLPQPGGDPNGSWHYMETNFNGLDVHADLGLTDDILMQLEAGVGEYAWGNLPIDSSFWDQISFD